MSNEYLSRRFSVRILPAATVIPKCDYFFLAGRVRGVNVPCIQVPDRQKNRRTPITIQ
jgi:hypothetical protein